MAATSIIDPALKGLLLVGDYGSGKTEVAVNLALRLAAEAEAQGGGGRVAIADLDLVNPYFRSREAREPLEAAGVRVVMPEGGHQYADLPILLPAVKGLLQDRETRAILDVGGDEAGSRVLSALGPAYDPARHGFWFVVNGNRPFTESPEACLRTIRRIEASAGLAVSGLVSNTHLMQETTPEMVSEGLALARAVAVELGVGVRLVAVMAEVARKLSGLDELPCPLLEMRRLMVPPWIRRDDLKSGPEQLKPGPG